VSHPITRRDFFRIGAAGLTSAVLAGCQAPRRWVTLEPYVRPPEEQLAGVATWYASTCRQCPAGCGVVVRVMNGRALKIEGNPEHPLSQGKLCARGQAGLQVLYNPDRLSGPVQQVRRGSRQFQALSWEGALNAVYAKIEAAGSALAVWGDSTMSGHLYDLFRRFSAAVGAEAPVLFDLYSGLHGYDALLQSSRALLGSDGLPAYNLGQADVVLSFSADFLGTWLSAVRYGVEFGAFRSQPLGKRGYLVQLEPRLSITATVADQWLPIRPGTEALVAQALARIIADEALGSADRVAAAQMLAAQVDVGSVAAASDIAAEELERLARIFASAEHPLAVPGGSLGGQDHPAEAMAAVQALNLIAGNAGQSGGLALSPEVPQPALARPAVSYADVLALIERMRAGEVQVLLVHGGNPVYELPQAAGLLEALSQVPFVVSFAPLVDETAVQSDLILPDRTYLESWGYEVVSPSFGLPVVSSQQPVVTPAFDARSAGDVLLTVARGVAAAATALPWADEVAFLKETVGQLPAGAAGGSGPDMLWARFLQHGGWWPASAPASASPGPSPSQAIEVTPTQFQGDAQEYPYFLHLYTSNLLSDGRGANQPWLQGSPDPLTTASWQTWVELHPSTAQKLGVTDGDVVEVGSPYGALQAPVYIYPAIRPDTVGIPTGQGHSDYGRYARDRGQNPMQLVGAQTDASGRYLAWSAVRVKVVPTGKKATLVLFENKLGVTEGFINQSFPGE
jgi:anaerobic selenocysteine-containing dehydrogenase